MKCDELEVMILEDGIGQMCKCYDVKEVDAAIEELKAKLENVQASMYADVVDANMENRRLKRALYKACANWAHKAKYVYDYEFSRWEDMERKCLAKAEQYK